MGVKLGLRVLNSIRSTVLPSFGRLKPSLSTPYQALSSYSHIENFSERKIKSQTSSTCPSIAIWSCAQSTESLTFTRGPRRLTYLLSWAIRVKSISLWGPWSGTQSAVINFLRPVWTRVLASGAWKNLRASTCYAYHFLSRASNFWAISHSPPIKKIRFKSGSFSIL